MPKKASESLTGAPAAASTAGVGSTRCGTNEGKTTQAGRGVEQQARVLQGGVEAEAGARVGALVGDTRLWQGVS